MQETTVAIKLPKLVSITAVNMSRVFKLLISISVGYELDSPGILRYSTAILPKNCDPILAIIPYNTMHNGSSGTKGRKRMNPKIIEMPGTSPTTMPDNKPIKTACIIGIISKTI
jgi:hypothetical protein